MKDVIKLKEKKLLAFNKNKIKAQHNVIDFSDRLKYNGKLLGFVNNKIEAELKDLMKLKREEVAGVQQDQD